MFRIYESLIFCVLLYLCFKGPTLLLEQNLAAHISNNEQRLDKKKQGLKGSFSSYGSWETSSSGTNKVTRKSIRFQVIVWTIERPDVSLSQVNMKFRVTLFWNAHIDVLKKEKEIDFQTGSWRMHGRSKAIFCSGNALEKGSSNEMLVDVPPLAILNANSFQAIGTPEVLLLREKDGLMRWSCLYKATLSQAEMTVTNFPHDTHYLRIQLGILQNRYAGAMWDRNVWDLNLATEDDSRGSTRTPYGLVVDRLKIPEFTMGSEGAEFSFVDLPRGFQAFTGTRDNKETCLHVSIRVKQQSTYYDINIIPLVTVITAVAITALLALDATNFFQRSLLMLNCAFVEVGLRCVLHYANKDKDILHNITVL